MLLQIGYIIYLVNETIKANIIHWSSIMCKQVTRNVLTVKLYGMIYWFNIKAVIKSILGKILRSAVLSILYTKLKFLYNYLIKLSTI